MKHMQLTSMDVTQKHIAQLGDLFPNAVTESVDEEGNPQFAIDFDLLRQELADNAVEGPKERYRLDWPGKRKAALAANSPIAKTLRPQLEQSVNFENTKNVFIEGDNLEALKLLQESYLGKIKMIYIDPPYNTGNDFVYADDFAESAEDYLLRSEQTTEANERLMANPETNGRFHSTWLSMIYPRLKLARNLLTDDGVIFMSINDAEFGNLQSIASEVFGANNFVGTMVWAAGRKNDSKFISASHEYILCYSRNLNYLRENNITWKTRKGGLDRIYAAADRLVKEHNYDYSAASQALKEWFRSLPENDPAKRHSHYSFVDERGVYFAADISWPGGGGPRYSLFHPNTGRPVRVPSGGWRLKEDSMKEKLKEGRIHFGKDENTVPTYKRYLRETEFEVPYSVFYQDGRAASKRLKSLMEGKVFDFPKDETVIQSLVEMTTGEGDIVLDFFAGSGTTAHSVMAQNVKDNMNRSFIMVQLDEKPAEKSMAAKQGYESIAEIARERIKRAAANLHEDTLDASNFDTGFRAFSIDSTNKLDTLFSADNTDQLALESLQHTIKKGRSGEDILFEVLLDWGLGLSMPISLIEVDEQKIYDVEDATLLACFDESITMEVVKKVAEKKPLRAVFLDSAFESDAERINAEQVFREFSRGTELKVI
ncbi:site-specific DNA-methyltransferase [Corynebacterium phoceense]